MRHPIDPTVDYAFKRLFGDPQNEDLLIDFLNSILRPESPIIQAQVINPFNEREFSTDKLTIVDVKAMLEDGRRAQVEVQLSIPPGLPERILYTWSDVYGAQLSHGEDYTILRPVASIWVLRECLFEDEEGKPKRGPHSHFQLWDRAHGNALTDHISIHLLELPRFNSAGGLDGEARWLYFLKEAGGWTKLPPRLNTPVMRKAMKVLEQISQKEVDYFAYQARQNYLREQATANKVMAQLKHDVERMEAEKQRMEAEKQRIEAEKQQAEAEKQQAEARARRLAAALRAAGIDPDEVLGDEDDPR